MANVGLTGFDYDATGAVVAGTANVYTRNTTTPVVATVALDGTGKWTFDITDGRYDTEVVVGTSKVRRKYDDQLQVTTIETANLRVRNPAGTFKYDIVPAAITADRTLNLPLITATETLAVLSQIGITREGGNTTEATTTSTTAVSLLAAASLTILAAEPFDVRYGGRKTAGAAVRAVCGLSINATTIAEAHATVDVDSGWNGGTTNQAEHGPAHIWATGRVTSYDVGIDGITQNKTVAGALVANSPLAKLNKTAVMPIATITDIAVRGIVGDAAVTLGADELQVYSRVAS